MSTEDASYISDLQSSRPDGSESLGVADDQIRLLKRVLQNTFPGLPDDPWDQPLAFGPETLNSLLEDATPGNYVNKTEDQTVGGVKTFTLGIVAEAGVGTTDGRSMIGPFGANILVGELTNALQLLANDVSGVRVNYGSEVPGGPARTARVLNEDNWQDIIRDQLHPVGSVIFTINNVNPSGRFGGSWSQIAQGRFLVGTGTGTAQGQSRNYPVGNDSTGEYQHTLTHAELPEGFANSPNPEVSISQAGRDDGGADPHENSPPAFGLYVWQRTG